MALGLPWQAALGAVSLKARCLAAGAAARRVEPARRPPRGRSLRRRPCAV
jgi:hypothetical protein